MFTHIRTALLLLILFVPAMVSPATAQNSANKWVRLDVNLTLQQNSGLTVQEVHEVALAGGATTFTKIIPTDKLETVNNVKVSLLSTGGRAFTQADSGADYTFQLVPSGSNALAVELHFPPNSTATSTFSIEYFVTGAVQFHDTGNRLDWRPFGPAAPAPIDSSKIVVFLPDGFTQAQLAAGSSGVPAESFVPEDNRAEYRAVNVPAGGEWEISLNFPRGVIQGAAPAWQRTADSFGFWTPVLQGGSVIVALLLLVLGPLAAYGWWAMRLRVKPQIDGEIPQTLKSPPSHLSPAVAGMLLDGKSQPRHLLAILLDLAARDAVRVYPDDSQSAANYLVEESPEASTDESAPEFSFYGVDQVKAKARPYEETVYTKIFGFQGGRKRKLSDVRRTLYMAVPEIKNQIDVEIARAGYFPEQGSNIRRQYLAFGGAAIILSFLLGLLFTAIFSQFTYLVICPFLSLIVAAFAFIVAGFAAPRHTQVGATEAVRWQAFRRYLKTIDKQGAAKSRIRFARLLPYATAFGFEKEFVAKFSRVKTPAPKWWSVPPAKVPDTRHEDAHAWVSASQMEQTPAASTSTRQSGRPSIRRLGAEKDGPTGPLLKDIQAEFSQFIADGLAAFSKAPTLDEDEEIDFDSLGKE